VHRVRDTAKPDFPKQLPGDQQRVLWVTRSPDTGFEECYNSSGRGKEGPGESGRTVYFARGGQVASSGIRVGIEFSLFR
jgi:hypothetical protein